MLFSNTLYHDAATLDLVFSWKAWGSMRFSQILRYTLKFVVAAIWAVVLPISYANMLHNPKGLLGLMDSWGQEWQKQSFFYYAIAIYMTPNALAVLLFFTPYLRRTMERSSFLPITLMMWWSQVSMSADSTYITHIWILILGFVIVSHSLLVFCIMFYLPGLIFL